MSRYVVGIDLGTTNCALAYADPGRRARRRELQRRSRTWRSRRSSA